MGRKLGGSVMRIVIRLHKLREVLWPLGLLFRGQGSKQIRQRATESLALRVATGMVWGGPGLLDATELTQGYSRAGSNPDRSARFCRGAVWGARAAGWTCE